MKKGGLSNREVSETLCITIYEIRKRLNIVGYKGTNRTWTKEKMISAIKNSTTYSGVIQKIGLKVTAGNYRTVRKFVVEESIDISHMTGQASGRGGPSPISLKDLLVKESTYTNTTHVKKRLLKEGLLDNRCYLQDCPNPEPLWKGVPLVMRIDHINGINNDHRIENLRLVCPNCDSQLPTFCRGKNK